MSSPKEDTVSTGAYSPPGVTGGGGSNDVGGNIEENEGGTEECGVTNGMRGGEGGGAGEGEENGVSRIREGIFSRALLDPTRGIAWVKPLRPRAGHQ